MREEHAYFCLKFQAPTVSLEVPQVPLALEVRQVQEVPLAKKQRKVRVKKPVQTSEVQSEDVQLSLEKVEMKDVIVTVSEKTFRDPKEMKEFQKVAVEAKRKENEAAGFQPSHFLTKENLK